MLMTTTGLFIWGWVSLIEKYHLCFAVILWLKADYCKSQCGWTPLAGGEGCFLCTFIQFVKVINFLDPFPLRIYIVKRFLVLSLCRKSQKNLEHKSCPQLWELLEATYNRVATASLPWGHIHQRLTERKRLIQYLKTFFFLRWSV